MPITVGVVITPGTLFRGKDTRDQTQRFVLASQASILPQGYSLYPLVLGLDKIFHEFNLIFLIKIQGLVRFAFSIIPLSFFHTENPSQRLLEDLGGDRITIAC